MTPETRKLLEAGKLEQTCGQCGRWSAASRYCSWCFRPMGPADWSTALVPDEIVGRRERSAAAAKSIADQRAERMPKTAPADPPSEYRDARSWPAAWGPCPYRKDRARLPQRSLDADVPSDPVSLAISPESPCSTSSPESTSDSDSPLADGLSLSVLLGAQDAPPSPPERAG